MGLARYSAKRDFARTPEPPARPARSKGHLFVVQKHAARRLHYDLRLELHGVLKSWAVTRGPSLVPGERRLAVETEDHPLDYANFEGSIPAGQYGAGRVIVWDRGTWQPIGNAEAGLRKGHLKFQLAGKKLSGLFDLIRMDGRGSEKRHNWLLLKAHDEHARAGEAPDVLIEQPQSVQSGRTIDEIEPASSPPQPKSHAAGRAKARGRRAKAANPEPGRPEVGRLSRAKAASLPAFVEPQLARAAPKAPAGPDWIHEIKLDGYRLQARIDHGRVKLLTRSKLDWTSKFATLAKVLADLAVDQALLDGEVVAETSEGFSSFSALQSDLKEGRDSRLVYYAFDLLHLNGQDLARTPLLERKRALAAIVPREGTGFVRFNDHFETDGETLKKHVCRIGFEGIVSKRADAVYRGGRGNDWLKIKCSNRQELIVIGYVPSTTARRAIGSLALGLHENKQLVYVGKVGTGFSTKLAEDLWRRLEPLRRATTSARMSADADIAKVRWTEPRLVAEIEFREWTAGGHVRQAVFHGLRLDKDASEVTREPALSKGPARGAGSRKAKPEPAAIKLTHPDRVYWSDVGISKQGLADYYTEIWDWIAPHIIDRPLAFLRCPGGIDGDCFFQKHAWSGLDPKRIVPHQIGDEQVLAISSIEGALALVQAGVLEIHPWGSRIGDPEHPDLLIFDLDPGEGVDWPEIEATAIALRDRLAGMRLRAFAKTTGGKGLHVVVPITPGADWTVAKSFTQRVATAMANEAKDRYTAKLSKSARRGRIFIDYLRNGRGATAVAAYSPRARPGAPVSTPLAWEELGAGISPAHFTIANIRRRLYSLDADPWADFARIRQTIPQ